MRILPLIIAIECLFTLASASSAQHADGGQWWVDVELKAHSVLIDPASGERSTVYPPLPHPMGLVSPDGKRVAYVGSDPQRVKDGHDFDLFVADVDLSQPSGKANARRLTTDQQHPADPLWLPDSSGIVFIAGDNAASQAWYIDLGEGSKPVRLSDGTHRCYDVSITPEARVAWVVHKGSKNKQQFKDLVLHPSLLAKGHMQTLIADQHICAYAISPDGKTLAWSDPGSLLLMNLQTRESREIPMQGVHPKLLHHAAHEIAWRPDGKIIAMRCSFVGGTSGERPRMFAEDKVFFVPVDGGWTPTPESLKIGTRQEDYPSPFADDPDAEISPPAGDESKPWWISELPDHVLDLKWIGGEQARSLLEKD